MAVTIKGSGQIIVQVVTVSKNDVFSSSVTQTYTDITGLSATITPTNSSNKILVFADIFSSTTTDNATMRLLRDSTAISAGTASGSQIQSSFGDSYTQWTTYNNGQSLNFVDSPSTTSAVTYKIQFWLRSGAFYVNANYANINANYVFKPASNITLMEISG